MLKYFKKQRGAMFGLDARIALAIMASLSVVTGASMVQLMKDNRVEEMLYEHERVSSAFDAMQEDMETNLVSALNTTSAVWGDLYRGLTDVSRFGAAYQPRWRGPYQTEQNSIMHEEFGRIRIRPMPSAPGVANCSAVQISQKLCNYYLMWGLSPSHVVPDQIKQALNDRLDGESEVDPDTNGKVRWDATHLYAEISFALN